MPNYVISQAPGKVILRNYEGFITTYTEPEDYNPHAIAPLEAKVLKRPEPGQEGVLGLLQSRDMFIKPKNFGEVGELVIGGGEEPLGLSARVLVEVLDDGPGQRHAVEGRGAAADLVEED